MNKLETARNIINSVDRQMAELFTERMKAVKMVIEHKIENSLPVLDEKREQQVIEKNSEFITDEVLLPYYVEFLKNTIEVSKKYQRKILEDSI